MKKVILSLLGGLILIGGSCVKNPIGPITARGPILFAVTSPDVVNNTTIYFIDTSSDSLVDSMVVPTPPGWSIAWGLGVSNDGSKLYISDLVIDIKTKTILAGLRSGVPTPDGKYLLDSRGNVFEVIDAQTHQVVHSDSIKFLVQGIGREFDERRGLVYGPYDDTLIGVYDYKNFQLVKVINPIEWGGFGININYVVVTKDGRKLYYGSFVGYQIFVGLDLVAEEVISAHILNGFGTLGVTPDDRNVYVTDAGGYLLPPPPSNSVFVYSTYRKQFLDPIQVCDNASSSNPCGGGVATDAIQIAPDGRKAYVSSFFGYRLFVIDTFGNRVIKVIQLPRPTIRSLTIRKFAFLNY